MSGVAALWSALAPFMILLWAFQRLSGLRGWRGVALAAGLAAAATVFPWFGHPLPYWSSALSANFSVIMMVLLAAGVVERARGATLLRVAGWRAAWVFGAVASVLLYPSAFGAGPHGFDLYALGWPWLFPGQSLVLFVLVAGLASVLIWRRNRFGYVLVASLIAFIPGWQESRNVWDYLLDPVYGTVSLLWVLWMIFFRWIPGVVRAAPGPGSTGV